MKKEMRGYLKRKKIGRKTAVAILCKYNNPWTTNCTKRNKIFKVNLHWINSDQALNERDRVRSRRQERIGTMTKILWLRSNILTTISRKKTIFTKIMLAESNYIFSTQLTSCEWKEKSPFETRSIFGQRSAAVLLKHLRIRLLSHWTKNTSSLGLQQTLTGLQIGRFFLMNEAIETSWGTLLSNNTWLATLIFTVLAKKMIGRANVLKK